jgi:hypothetical protein
MDERTDRTDRAVMSPPKRRHFTPASATRALVLVRRVVADVVREYEHLGELQETLETSGAGESTSQGALIRQEIATTVQRIHDLLEELDAIGVELKEWTRGIVDFPCLLTDDGEVSLCWAMGEPAVAYWHETHETYAQRQPVQTLNRRSAPVA